MKSNAHYFFFSAHIMVTGLSSAGTLLVADEVKSEIKSGIVSKEFIESTLKEAQRLLKDPYPNLIGNLSLEKIKSPFCAFALPPEPPPPQEKVKEQQGPPKPTSASILSGLVPYLRPSGVFERDNEWILVFNDRVVKTGDALEVSYQGQNYVLTIGSISSSDFEISFDGVVHKISLTTSLTKKSQ